MGNQASGDGHGNTHSSRPVRGFMRPAGVLGLSRSELDERCKPSGLYPSCLWEEKAIRKLIGDGKMSARLKGSECRASASDQECPICFLHYSQINITKCCQGHICTECYLQVRPQKEKSPHCPFCNHNRVTVVVAKKMDGEAIMQREEEEQRVIEAKVRAQNHVRTDNGEQDGCKHVEGEQTRTTENSSSSNPSPMSTCQKAGSSSVFGSSLEKHEGVARQRARTYSNLSDSHDKIPENEAVQSFAMTPDERRSLEEEMRAQHSHPLSLRLEAEADERRVQNERDYYRTHGGRLLEMRSRAMSAARRGRMHQNRTVSDSIFSAEPSGSRRRDWNQIVDAFERGGNGEVSSIDDIVVLEAAMILSMEEESRRRVEGRPRDESSTTGNGTASFNTSRHANEGFPLLRSLLAGRTTTNQDGDDADVDTPSSDSSEQVQSVSRHLYSRRRSRNTVLRSYRNASMNTALDTASLLMRGVSEEDQVAMAIAASLQDHQEPDNPSENEGNEEASTNIANSISSTETEEVENSDAARGNPIEGNNQSAVENTSEIASSTTSDYESTVEERHANNSSNESPPPIAAVASEIVNQIQPPNNLNGEENNTE